MFFSALIFIPCLCVYVVGTLEECEKLREANAKVMGWSAVVFFFGLVFSLAPDKDEIVFLTGGYYAFNSEEVRDLPENFVGAINKFLEQYQEELSKEEK